MSGPPLFVFAALRRRHRYEIDFSFHAHLLPCLTRFGRDELIHRRILGFQIGERYHAVAHLDDAVTLAGVAQK